MKSLVDERLSESKAIADRMLGSKTYLFADLKPSDLKDGLPVVYAIFDKNTGETLYVGRTKNLRQRLYNNHLMGQKSNARLKKYLVEDPTVTNITTMAEAKQYLRGRQTGSLSYRKFTSNIVVFLDFPRLSGLLASPGISAYRGLSEPIVTAKSSKTGSKNLAFTTGPFQCSATRLSSSFASSKPTWE